MGGEVSAVTKLFLKPKGSDVFPSAGHPEDGWQVLGGLAAARKAPVKVPKTPLPGTSPSLCSPSGQS